MFTNKIKHFLLSGGILIAAILVNPISMVPIASVPTEVQAAVAPTVDPQADEIIWMFRVNNGIREKRRWNASRNCWVDPYWIPY